MSLLNRKWGRASCAVIISTGLAAAPIVGCTGETVQEPEEGDAVSEQKIADTSERVATADSGTGGAMPYTVQCETDPESGAKECYVDKGTFTGWRFYHAFCHVCHAQDGVGSTFAPSLVERLQVIDRERFDDVLENGYTGQIGVMPGWKDNPNISKRYDELYAYLKARSDGVLPPGRPQKMKAPAAE